MVVPFELYCNFPCTKSVLSNYWTILTLTVRLGKGTAHNPKRKRKKGTLYFDPGPMTWTKGLFWCQKKNRKQKSGCLPKSPQSPKKVSQSWNRRKMHQMFRRPGVTFIMLMHIADYVGSTSVWKMEGKYKVTTRHANSARRQQTAAEAERGTSNFGSVLIRTCEAESYESRAADTGAACKNEYSSPLPFCG